MALCKNVPLKHNEIEFLSRIIDVYECHFDVRGRNIKRIKNIKTKLSIAMNTKTQPKKVTHRPIIKNADRYCRVCGKDYLYNKLTRSYYFQCDCDPSLENKKG